jgi:O-antigen/teichoic acid export membrane protein
MRIKNSLLNVLSGIVIRLVTLSFNFISRTIFINTLGVTYLGVNGLMTNVMTMLSIAELGIGSAITFSLYGPLAHNNTKKIILLMSFYKQAYRIIGIIIFLIGLILTFFLDVFIKDVGKVENLRLIFFLYIVSTSFPYFINYKLALIKADQKEYKLTNVNIIFTILIIISQITVLLVTNNFILYLISNITILFVQTIYINLKVTRMYPLLKIKLNEKLPKEELKTIITKIKAMVLHKIGSFSIYSTDNIIISAFISINVVGLYSNYSMIINSVNSFITLGFNSITASMGNLIATSSNLKKLEIFKVTNFIGFWIYGVSTISFYNLINPTIELWLGSAFLLPQEIILVVLINYYMTGMRIPIETVKSASGLYEVDKFSPLIQSAINLTLSIILVEELGLLGVFIGTLISSLILPTWQKPYLVYKHVFKISSKSYFSIFIKFIFVLLGMGLITHEVLNTFFEDYTVSNYLIRIAICAIIPNIIIILLFKQSKEFKEVIRIVKSIIKKE